MDHCFPEYDIWTQFVSADYTRALDLDALDNSHPIEVHDGFMLEDLKGRTMFSKKKEGFLKLGFRRLKNFSVILSVLTWNILCQ